MIAALTVRRLDSGHAEEIEENDAVFVAGLVPVGPDVPIPDESSRPSKTPMATVVFPMSKAMSIVPLLLRIRVRKARRRSSAIIPQIRRPPAGVSRGSGFADFGARPNETISAETNRRSPPGVETRMAPSESRPSNDPRNVPAAV